MNQLGTAASREAQILSRYLLGRTADRQTCELYEKATASFTRGTAARDERIATFAITHPWSLAPLDGALALVNPHSVLRQKLLIAAAILEACPAYYDAFLSQERSKAYLLTVMFVLIRAACRAVLGLLLLRYIR